MTVEVVVRALALLPIAALVAISCGPGPVALPVQPAVTSDADVDIAGPVTVTLWHTLGNDPQKTALEAMVKRFNDTNGKRITVTGVVQGSYTQLYQKTLSAIGSNALPDMVLAYESFVPDFAKAGLLVDLDPYVTSAKNGLTKRSQDDIFRPSLDAGRLPQLGDKLLSFPFSRSIAVMYTDLDVLARAGITSIPKTWSEWEDAVKRTTVKDASGRTTQYGTTINTDATYFNAGVVAMGGKLMSDDNKTVAWNGKEGLAYLQILDRLAKGGYAYVPTGFDHLNDLANGKLGSLFSSTTNLPYIVGAEKAPAKLAVTVFPQADPAASRTVQFGGNLALLRGDPQKQLASWLFIKWSAEQEQTAQWAAQSAYMPVRQSAADTQTLKDYWTKMPLEKQAFDTVAASSPEPNVRGQQEIRDVITNMIVSVASGKATPEQALKDAGTRANAILKEAQ